MFNGADHYCLLDTGAEQSVFPSRLVKNLKLTDCDVQLMAANGTDMPVDGMLHSGVKLENGTHVTDKALITGSVREPMFGLPFMKRNDVKWLIGSGTLVINGGEIPVYSRVQNKKAFVRHW